MKTKLLKLGMPIVAFMLAIVCAFATNSKPVSEDMVLVDGYIFQNGKCELVRKCSTIEGPRCLVGMNLRVKINETQCGSELYHWNNEM